MKKLKILASIMTFVAIVLVANCSFAVVTIEESNPDTTLTIENSGHTDSWTGRWELLPYHVEGETAVGGTYCMQKHQALRFTPMAAIELNGSSTETLAAHREMHAYGEREVPSTYARNTVINNIKGQMKDKLTDLGWGIADVGEGDLANYGIGSYRYESIKEDGNIIAVSDTYSKTPTYTGQGIEAHKNTYIAYILSSGAYFNPITSFGLKQGNYAGAISDVATGDTNGVLIQDAVWASAFNETASDGVNYRREIPEIAVKLVAEAEAYERYTSKLSNYSATFLDTNPKVLPNTETGTYSIGPLKISYPDDTRFSYIQDIYLVDGNGNKIETSLLKIHTTSGNKYPASGEQFFIEFDKNVGEKYTRVNVKAEFAYISLTYAEIERYFGIGEIAQMIGTITSSTDRHVYRTEHHDAQYDNFGNKTKDAWDEDFYCSIEYLTGKYNESIVGEYDPQDLFTVIKVKREWVEDYATTYADRYVPPTPPDDNPPSKKPPKDIDLTTSLGGFVWVDEETGKEDVANGIYDKTEKRVPNIIVKLYDAADNKFVAETKTNANGEYKFEGLNAFHKYYVEFIYNGQYYEPTTYTSPYDKTNGWGRGNWQNNSNATDKIAEREAFNNKFASIGSSPANYDGSKTTYTKQELINAKVIDEFGNLINANSEMATYVIDSRTTAHTGNNTSYDSYVIPDIYVVDNEARVKNAYGSMYNMREVANKVAILFPDAYYINLGLHPRQDADIAIKKDIQKVDLEINGQKHTYTYDTLENKPNAEGTWEIGVRISDGYFNVEYSRELYKADYIYKVSNYGENFAEYGKSKADEINVYVTYKIMVRNQSQSIRTRIDELVDYYDTDYEIVPERSYIQIAKGNNAGKYAVGISGNSIYGAATQNTISGFDSAYITGLGKGAKSIDNAGNVTAENANGIYLDGGQTAYFYLTFKVKKDTINGEDWLKIDENISTGEIGIGKENIVELNGYSTIYGEGTVVPNIGDVSGKPAGIIDRDSNPGNLKTRDINTFEDDTDKAPNIKIVLFKDDEANRVIAGSAWEDIRNKKVSDATVGNGVYNTAEGDSLINGVTVQLVELMENGTEYVWRTTETGPETKLTPIINGTVDGRNIVSDYAFDGDMNGVYAFKSFVPGRYVVRFIYGDTEKTVVNKDLATLLGKDMANYNAKSYNGQDYKTTTYQSGIAQNNVYTWRAKSSWVNGQEILGNVLTEVSTFKADASNNESVVNVAEKKLQGELGYLYDITASDASANVSDVKDIKSVRESVNNYSNNNGKGVVNYLAEVLASHKADYATMNDRETLLKDLMQNTKMTAESGLMVIGLEYAKDGSDGNDKTAKYAIENVDLGLEERPKTQLALNKEVTKVKVKLADNSTLFDAKDTTSNVLWKKHKGYETGYNGNLLDAEKFGNIQNIRMNHVANIGLVGITMDEELMHGATIEIAYNLTVTNVSEVDYKDDLFYYTGVISNGADVVTTTANKVIDYVSNNLQFSANDNKEWKVISVKDIKSEGLVNTKLVDSGLIEKYNTIIVTDELAKELQPVIYSNEESSVSVPLKLSQVLTSENKSDDLTYRNIAEIVQTSNTVGRRNEFSVVGNQIPSEDPTEIDTDLAEVVRILPPFGDAGIYIIISIVTLVAVGLVITGVIFIKKKVLTK